MEARNYTMKYKAYKKREREMLANGLKAQINEIQDSNEEEDVNKLEMLIKCLQDPIDHEDTKAAIQMLAKYHLQGEKPTKFFSSMIKRKKDCTVLDPG